jgi:hypothetical protein
MLEKRETRRLSELKGEEERRGWRKLHNEEFHHLYHSSNLIMAFQTRKM